MSEDWIAALVKQRLREWAGGGIVNIDDTVLRLTLDVAERVRRETLENQYPTTWAYEQVCAARTKWHKRADDLGAVLKQIANSEEECGCTHDTDDCCNAQGVFCAHCLAGAALAAGEPLTPQEPV